MTAQTKQAELPAEAVTLVRLIEAPRERVFRAWIDPKQLAKWWGPEGFTNPVCEVDARPGGAIRILMRGPDGTDYPMRGTFRELVEPERLVFEQGPVDQNGNRLIEAVTTVTFAAQGDQTKLTVHTSAVPMTELGARMLKGMQTGWNKSFDRLAELMSEAHV